MHFPQISIYYNRVKILTYKILCLFFYYSGDLLSKLMIVIDDVSYFFYRLYQKCMKLSLHYDDLSGGNLWKKP
jgi:hypothetical protein